MNQEVGDLPGNSGVFSMGANLQGVDGLIFIPFTVVPTTSATMIEMPIDNANPSPKGGNNMNDLMPLECDVIAQAMMEVGLDPGCSSSTSSQEKELQKTDATRQYTVVPMVTVSEHRKETPAGTANEARKEIPVATVIEQRNQTPVVQRKEILVVTVPEQRKEMPMVTVSDEKQCTISSPKNKTNGNKNSEAFIYIEDDQIPATAIEQLQQRNVEFPQNESNIIIHEPDANTRTDRSPLTCTTPGPEDDEFSFVSSPEMMAGGEIQFMKSSKNKKKTENKKRDPKINVTSITNKPVSQKTKVFHSISSYRTNRLPQSYNCYSCQYRSPNRMQWEYHMKLHVREKLLNKTLICDKNLYSWAIKNYPDILTCDSVCQLCPPSLRSAHLTQSGMELHAEVTHGMTKHNANQILYRCYGRTNDFLVQLDVKMAKQAVKTVRASYRNTRKSFESNSTMRRFSSSFVKRSPFMKLGVCKVLTSPIVNKSVKSLVKNLRTNGKFERNDLEIELADICNK